MQHDRIDSSVVGEIDDAICMVIELLHGVSVWKDREEVESGSCEKADSHTPKDKKPLQKDSSPKLEKPLKRQRSHDDSEFKPKKIKVEKKLKRKWEEMEEDAKPEKSKDMDATCDGRKKAKKELDETWKWWEEERNIDGSKWKCLEHKGPVFAPLYKPLPDHVKFYYDGKPMKLSPNAEEVATFFAKMLDHEYTTKNIFRKNFFMDWRKEMTSEEKAKITELKKCDFREMNKYFKAQLEAKKQISKEEKQRIKKENELVLQKYGFCVMDNHKERIANFHIEPPGLFCGHGHHPKMGMLKRRVQPEDVIINCSKDSDIPKPPPGTKWKEVRLDKKVTWLASWMENIQGSMKYIMLNPSSRIKACVCVCVCTCACISYPSLPMDRKYETARRLKMCVEHIRNQYREEVQRDVDPPALCGAVLHRQELMDGLTGKVFRTYNTSITLQRQLKQPTTPEDNIPLKILSYNRAAAIPCNHQRAPTKTYEKSMQNLQTKTDAKKQRLLEAKWELKRAKVDAKVWKDEKTRKAR
ncbi:DNA topoisomerase 1-like [Paramormyrops kingsleyae]|uniref:DNA topoisomerase 1-like n=1 Tax=Paramormyrops kingsleyae TaxID=1676925 RepID=UPI003B97948E